MTNQPYLYKLTQKSTGKWYIGSRTAKNCKPNESYICSSRHVLPLYKENKEDWTREILVIGPADYIRDLESKYLVSLNAKNNEQSFNLHNGDGKFTTAGKKLLRDTPTYLFTAENRFKRAQGVKRAWDEGLYDGRKKLLGNENPSKRPEVRKAISEAMLGKQGGRMTGKKHSEESKLKMAESRRLYWVNRKRID
jgi:hypothetical protein